MFYTPHTARLFTRSSERVDPVSADAIPSYLKELTLEDALMKWGIEGSRTAQFYFGLGQANMVSIGDRLLVNGDHWEVVKGPVRKNGIVILEHAFVIVKRVE